MEDDQNPNPPATDASNPPAPQQQQEQTIPYARFKAVNDEAKALKAQIAELSTKAGDRDALAGQVKDLNGRLLRQSVASAVGLPPELADRLRGDDEAAIKKDAETLLSLIPKKPAAPPLNGDTPTNDAPTFTVAQIKNPAFYAANRDKILQAQREGRIRD